MGSQTLTSQFPYNMSVVLLVLGSGILRFGSRALLWYAGVISSWLWLKQWSGWSKKTHRKLQECDISFKIIWTCTDEAPLLATYSFGLVVEVVRFGTLALMWRPAIFSASASSHSFRTKRLTSRAGRRTGEPGQTGPLTPEANIIKTAEYLGILVQPRY